MTFDEQRRRNSNHAVAGAFFVWILAIPAALPAFLATFMVLYFAFLPLTIESTEQGWLNLLCLILVGGVMVASPLLALRFADRWIPRMFRARTPGADERNIMRLVETLAPAAGLTSLDVRVIDSDAVNTALLGKSKSGWTLLMTSGCTSLKYDEQEAVVALALAGAASGTVAAGRMLLAATGPVVTLGRLASALATPKRMAATVTTAVVASLVAGFTFDHSVTNTIAFSGFILIGVAAFALPALAAWILLLAGTQALAAGLMVQPSRLAADAGALALTRYPPPMRRLLVRARSQKTRPSTFPVGLGAIWSLPVGAQGSKEQNLLMRIRRLDAMDPDGAIRSLGG
jgi:protein-S-isoprenylcysteine O-methyltransferase Ste14